MALPINVTKVMASASGTGPVTLIEIITPGGVVLYVSDQQIVANSVLTSSAAVTNLPWLASAATFQESKTTKTSTGKFTLQNLSGDTVMRDLSRIFSMTELTGSICFCRVWLPAAEAAIYSWLGKMREPEERGDTFACSLIGFDNWSMIKAPPFHVGETCGLDFGSVECGSTATTPCNQSYGTCSSIERMKSVIVQWNGAPLDYTQVVQPAQSVQMNNQRPF